MRRLNYRLVKIHRSYSVEEAAALFGTHRNTVRRWIKVGLPTSDERRPILILGHDLAEFLKVQRAKNKRVCRPGEIYCVRCREPREPAGGMAEYHSSTPTHGSLVGICPVCEAWMYRRVNLARIRMAAGDLEVSIPRGTEHINESNGVSVNGDFN